MISQVNSLIYNTLCKGSDVALPSIGSLVVRRSAAKKGKGGFVPPQRTVTFTGELRGVNIVDAIASAAAVETSRAEEIYEQWLGTLKRDGVIIIEGVGAIKSREFTPDQALLEALNPLGTSTPVPKKRGIRWGLIAIVVAILLAIAVVAILLMRGAEQDAAIPVVEPVAPVVEAVVEPEPAPAVDGVERMAVGGNYIVWGVFSELDNAKRYERLIERQYPELDCKIYHHRDDTMFLLAVDEGPTRTACLERMWDLQEKDGLFDEMWIFTNK